MIRKFKDLASMRSIIRLGVAALFFVSTMGTPVSGVFSDAAAHGKKKKKTETVSEKSAGAIKPVSSDSQRQKEKGNDSEKNESHPSDSK